MFRVNDDALLRLKLLATTIFVCIVLLEYLPDCLTTALSDIKLLSGSLKDFASFSVRQVCIPLLFRLSAHDQQGKFSL